MTPDDPADPDNQQTGASTVADEAMRLAEAFAVWAQNGKLAADVAAHDTSVDDTGAGTATEEPDRAAGARPPAAAAAPSCDCAHGAAVEAVCRMCPVCRMAGLVQAVQPDLLDRVADLLGLVAGGLHSAAEQRRTSTTGAGNAPDAGASGRSDGGMDVPVTGGDDD
ncbi:MAG TPA: hypothetical protein VG502_00425 [Flexivirga sp.]|uniref:hypothetical protein n=1 Tax=Flexivirga sp. TaxID=1962927 RepID=UPI002CB3FFFC|nr:hypothetical protein [Flexivirga sp.]HWC20736.1 hypothetical protein [Flexivirga sp.]